MSRFGAFAKRERYHSFRWEGIHAIVSTTSCILRQAAFLVQHAFGQAPANPPPLEPPPPRTKATTCLGRQLFKGLQS